VQIAQRRAAERLGIPFDNSRTVLIGDTPTTSKLGMGPGGPRAGG
jgi:phosphoglycolate phosphatase